MYDLSRNLLRFAVLGFVLVALIAIGSVFGPQIAVVALCVAGILSKCHKVIFTGFGTAKWATASDVDDMLDGDGLPLGLLADDAKPNPGAALSALFSSRLDARTACRRFLRPFSKRKPFVRLTKSVHTAVFGPTGAGKGVSFVIPYLKSCKESVVVIDFKGENAKLTAEDRKRLGHDVVLLDPFKVVTQTPDSFNPLDFIDRHCPTALDECRDLAKALVVRTGEEKDPHWADSAEIILTAMIALVVCIGEPNDRSLQTVRTLIADPKQFEMAIKVLCSSQEWGGMLARLGNQLTHYKDKELASTLTTVNRFINFLDTIPIHESTKCSTFDPRKLNEGNLSVFLILPPEHMRSQSPLLRLWIGSLLREVVKGGLQEKNKVHFVCDEAASLGRLEQIEDAIDKYRGYGVRLIFFFQSLGQLRKNFPEGQDQTFLSNVTQVYFAVNDMQTAEQVSNRLGEHTIVLTSGGTSSGTSEQMSTHGQYSTTHSNNKSDNWSQHGRKLLKPEEVLTLPQRACISFVPGRPPIMTCLVRYYEPGGDTSESPAGVLATAVVAASAAGFLSTAVVRSLTP